MLIPSLSYPGTHLVSYFIVSPFSHPGLLQITTKIISIWLPHRDLPYPLTLLCPDTPSDGKCLLLMHSYFSTFVCLMGQPRRSALSSLLPCLC